MEYELHRRNSPEVYIRCRNNERMSKRYVLNVEVDEHGECFVTLPDQLLEDAQWDVGDVLEYSEDIDGSIIITKVVT